MIVEFLGKSGAGKSTLVPVVVQLLRERGLTALSTTEAIHHCVRRTCVGQWISRCVPLAWQGPLRWRLFSYLIAPLYGVGFVSGHSRLAYYVVRSQVKRPIPWRHRWSLLRVFFEMAAWHQFLTRRLRSDETLVLDEGFVHRATHLFVSAVEQPDPDRIAEYLQLLPRSDVVVWVEMSLDACLERVYARGIQKRLRLRGLTESEVAQFIAHAEQVIHVTAQYLEDARWQVVQITNEGSLEESAAALREQLSALLDGRTWTR